MCSAVQRVHWLRARAQRDRWAEEFKLVVHEMQWVVNFFTHRSKVWSERAAFGTSVNAGALAFALRQSAMWRGVASSAKSTFDQVRRL